MKTILNSDIWSISSFIENKNYHFDKKNILSHLPEKFIDDAIKNAKSGQVRFRTD